MGSLPWKMYPPTLILFLLCSVASSVEITPENAKTYVSPRIVVLGAAGVGKSTFANALLNRPGDAKHELYPGGECFQASPPNYAEPTGKTTEACEMQGAFLGDPTKGNITVVDTPGLGMDLEEDSSNAEKIVKKLKNEIKYVHAFVMIYHKDANRGLNGRLAVIQHYIDMFGYEFLDNVIFAASFWRYNEDEEEENRDWLKKQIKFSNFSTLPNADKFKAIYFQPWKHLDDDSSQEKFTGNLTALYNWAIQRPTFECLTIIEAKPRLKKYLDDLERQRRELEEEKKRVAERDREISRYWQIENQLNETLEKLTECHGENGDMLKKSNTEMIGIGLGCTVLGLILGFLAFRYYKLNTNNANYNDDDDTDDENEDDLEKGERNNETSLLENNQPETETK